jgi:hypothetical protein
LFVFVGASAFAMTPVAVGSVGSIAFVGGSNDCNGLTSCFSSWSLTGR